jgi:hypothetical protein
VPQVLLGGGLPPPWKLTVATATPSPSASPLRVSGGIRYALTLDLETWEVIQRRAEQENVTVAVMLRHLIGWGLDQS